MPTEKLKMCPYNKAHMISVTKFQHHLVKCRKNNPHIQLEMCPFNATHLMPKEQIEDHLKVCENKKLIEPTRYGCTAPTQHGDLTPTPFHNPHQPINGKKKTNEENWDDGLDDDFPESAASSVASFRL